MKKISKVFVLSLFLVPFGTGGEKNAAVVTTFFPVNMFSLSLTGADTIRAATEPPDEDNTRKTSALVYSCIMPGAGQTMMGHPYKGVGFTLVAFGSVLTAVISHNNYIARIERLDALEYQYANTTTWVSADRIYNDMVGVQKKLVQDRDRRNIFLSVSAIVWAANIVDLLYNTEDLGQETFAVNGGNTTAIFANVDTPHRPLISLSLPLE